jgi:hypothetical protein
VRKAPAEETSAGFTAGPRHRHPCGRAARRGARRRG